MIVWQFQSAPVLGDGAGLDPGSMYTPYTGLMRGESDVQGGRVRYRGVCREGGVTGGVGGNDLDKD